MSIFYRLQHTTRYTYNNVVTTSLGRGYTTPCTTQEQRVHHHKVYIFPEPEEFSRGQDYNGNQDYFFCVTQPHLELVIDSLSLIEVSDPLARINNNPAAKMPWEEHRPAQSPAPIAHINREFTYNYDNDDDPRIQEYARGSFTPGRPLLDCVNDLSHRIFTDFTYTPGVTTLTTTPSELLTTKAGVCQDFARLSIACYRSLGLAARYVSGYLATTPPEGKEKVFGADASHAWVQVWANPYIIDQRVDDDQEHPRIGVDQNWINTDPTNDQLVGDTYITLARGRSYDDVAPLRGIVYSEAKDSRMSVSVDVRPLDNEAFDDAAVHFDNLQTDIILTV